MSPKRAWRPPEREDSRRGSLCQGGGESTPATGVPARASHASSVNITVCFRRSSGPAPTDFSSRDVAKPSDREGAHLASRGARVRGCGRLWARRRRGQVRDGSHHPNGWQRPCRPIRPPMHRRRARPCRPRRSSCLLAARARLRPYGWRRTRLPMPTPRDVLRDEGGRLRARPAPDRRSLAPARSPRTRRGRRPKAAKPGGVDSSRSC